MAFAAFYVEARLRVRDDAFTLKLIDHEAHAPKRISLDPPLGSET